MRKPGCAASAAGRATAVGRLSWALLGGALLWLLVVSLDTDVGAPGERETTHRMAALSLAMDGDLGWGREDHDRWLRLFGSEPQAVSLTTSSGGELVGFGRPPSYAVLMAPLARLMPTRAAPVLNWLLLAVASVASALVLERRAGPAAPAWIAAFCVGTTAFTLLPLANPEVLRLAASALGWALVVQVMPVGRNPGATDRRRRHTLLRWGLVGFFLSQAAVSGQNGAVLLPALIPAAVLAAVGPRARLAVLALLVGGASSFGASFGLAAHARGGAVAPERMVWTPSTGFPAVDFEQEEWGAPSNRAPGATTEGPGPSEAGASNFGVAGWRDALAGRTVGLVPCCLPVVWAIVAVLAAPRRHGWRHLLLLGGALGAVGLRVALFPFELGDETAAVGPASIAAVLPVFWFLASRAGAAKVASMVVASGLFMYPLWLHPGAALGVGPPPEGALHRFLPAEVGQRPRAGAALDLFLGDLWLRPVAGRASPLGEAGLTVDDGVEVLLAWTRPAAHGADANDGASGRHLELTLAPDPPELRAMGAVVETRTLLSSGETLLGLRLDAPEARRRMWWSGGRVDLFRLELVVDGLPASLRIVRIGSGG